MSQITHGIRAIFSHPFVYDGFQNLMGASGIRRELVRDFIRPISGMRVLDIGCGTAEIVRYLPEDVEYWGYDISASYIDAAKRRLGTRGHFHCGLLGESEVDKLPSFDVVTGFGLLHHMDDIDAIELFKLAKRALKVEGRVVTMDPCFVPNPNPIAQFLISRDRGQNVRTAEGYGKLPGSHFSRIDGAIRHRGHVPYTDWVMECAQ